MLSFFPLDVLDEIWDVIESVSEGFLTYSLKGLHTWKYKDIAFSAPRSLFFHVLRSFKVMHLIAFILKQVHLSYAPSEDSDKPGH